MSLFATTRWSQILTSREDPSGSSMALRAICEAYRKPVLTFIRGYGYRDGDAEDLAQEFFASLVERRWDRLADPRRGRFRALLLTALRRHLSDQASARTALRRGGGQARLDLDAVPEATWSVGGLTPEQAFDRDWALTLLQRALDRLRQEAMAAGKAAQLERLEEFLVEPAVDRDYQRLATELGMRSNTLAVIVHRLRRRLRELVRDELLQTVAGKDALDAEQAHLYTAFSSHGLE